MAMNYVARSPNKKGGHDEKVHLPYSSFDGWIHADRLFGYDGRAA
jgi:hypothetical protein